MSCEDVQDRLLEGADAIDDATRAHLETCAVCRIVDAERSRPPATAPDDFMALFAAVKADQAREHGPLAWLRSRPTWLRRGLIAGVGLLTAVIALVAMRRPDFASYPTGRFVLELLVMAAGLSVVVGVAVRSRLEVPSGRTSSLWVGFAILIPVALAILPQAHVDHPASLLGVGSDLIPRAIGCLVWGLVMGTPTAIIAFLARRDGHGEPRRDLLLAVAAGLAGVIALEAHCPITDGRHLLLGHATVVIVVVGVVALAGWLGGRARLHRGR